MSEQSVIEKEQVDLDFPVDRRDRNREWLAQVDFWEGVKEFILRRIPSASRPVDRLY